MATNQNAYNTRLTDETLEKRFRETFRSQGGAELVDDLYASGVIVPIVDFTAAAEGSALRQDLQSAWDFSTGSIRIRTTTFTTIINNTGFWQIDLNYSGFDQNTTLVNAIIQINDGTSVKPVWAQTPNAPASDQTAAITENKFVVFLRAGDTLEGKTCFTNFDSLDIWYRQVADVNGNLVNPLGFTF